MALSSHVARRWSRVRTKAEKASWRRVDLPDLQPCDRNETRDLHDEVRGSPMKHHPETIDMMVEIFTSILAGGGANKRLAVKLIRKLDAVGRRDLRAACQNLDALIEETWLEELRDKRIKKKGQQPYE
jgi:hypothetical protein